MNDEPTPQELPPQAFPDCALPWECACAARLRPEFEWTSCRAPAINKLARELGWMVPYPGALSG